MNRIVRDASSVELFVAVFALLLWFIFILLAGMTAVSAWNVSKLPVLQDDWRRTKLITACNQIGGNWQENSDGFSCSWR